MPKTVSRSFSLYYFLVVLQLWVLHLIIIHLLIHFELILYMVLRCWDKEKVSFFFMWISSFPNIICYRNYLFPVVCSWHPLWISADCKCLYPFSDPVLFHCSVHRFLGQYCFCYNGFVIYFETRKCDAFRFILTSWKCGAYLVSFLFHRKFLSFPPVFEKRTTGIWIGIHSVFSYISGHAVKLQKLGLKALGFRKTCLFAQGSWFSKS